MRNRYKNLVIVLKSENLWHDMGLYHSATRTNVLRIINYSNQLLEVENKNFLKISKTKFAFCSPDKSITFNRLFLQYFL